ncbi:hypothetical protein LBMAG42_08950 [Deltaproteobacteria bacterium]|nr:hypothetical protein LBMAG42_08950 [Deltaproteobacteria bacterium]
MRRVFPFLRLLFVPALGVTGGLVGWVAEESAIATALLLIEPILWVFAAWLAYAAWSRKDVGLTVGVVCGGLAAAMCVRIPTAPPETPGLDPAPFLARTSDCARELELPAQSVRLVQWTVSNDAPGIVPVITDAQADLVVVRGPLSPEVAAAVEAGVGGESMALTGANGPIHVFTRGVFSRCGEGDQWMDQPAQGADIGLLFVTVSPGTSFPLLVAGFPEVASVPQWATASRDARSALHTAAERLQSSILVVAVDAALPLGGPRLTRMLKVVGLAPAARPLNWPPRWPFSLHAFDQVWAAEAWVSAPAERLRAPGTGRDGVRVDLAPRWPVALPVPADDDAVR